MAILGRSYTVSPFSFQPLSGCFLPALAFASVASALPVLSACDASSEAPRPLPAPRSLAAPNPELAQLLRIDAGEIEAKVDPPAPAGDLKADIEGFTSIDACAADHAHLDPLLGDALEAIGYDTFVRDACRTLEAVKTNDPGRCADIDSSALGTQCRTAVAQVGARPDACPWVAPSHPERGRDGRCLALAARDPRLCAAAWEPADRLTCEATLTGDSRGCAKARTTGEQARCRRDAARWTGILAADGPGPTRTPRPRSAKPFTPQGTLRVERVDSQAPASGHPAVGALPLDLDITSDLEHGVVLIERRGETRLTIGRLNDLGPDFIAPSPNTRASFAVELVVAAPPSASTPPSASSLASAAGPEAGPRPAVRVERAELDLPGHAPVTTSDERPKLVATLGQIDRTRGGALDVTLDGELGSGEARRHIHLQASTFVRDLVRSADVYRGGPLGAAGGMP